MTVYVYRNQLNRPIKTRLIISVHFVAPHEDAPGAASRPYAFPGQHGTEASQYDVPRKTPRKRPATVASGRGTVAMRLRLIDSDASTKKEYHHAESLFA